MEHVSGGLFEPQRVVAEAMSWAGTPYRHQGSRKGVGCDCLGLVRGVWRALYGEEPERPEPYAPDWAEAGGEDRLLHAARWYLVETGEREPAAGNVILFRWRPLMPAKHAGIVTEPGRFIHAYEGHGVTISALVPQWRRRIAGVFAYPAAPSKSS